MRRTIDLGPLFERRGHQVPPGALVITVWSTASEALTHGDEEEFLRELAKLETFVDRLEKRAR